MGGTASIGEQPAHWKTHVCPMVYNMALQGDAAQIIMTTPLGFEECRIVCLDVIECNAWNHDGTNCTLWKDHATPTFAEGVTHGFMDRCAKLHVTWHKGCDNRLR